MITTWILEIPPLSLRWTRITRVYNLKFNNGLPRKIPLWNDCLSNFGIGWVQQVQQNWVRQLWCGFSPCLCCFKCQNNKTGKRDIFHPCTAHQSSLRILGGNNQLSSDFWSVIIKACLKGNHQILITIIGERASLKLKRKHSSDCETNCDKSKEKNINLRSWMLIAKEWSFKSTCDVDSSTLPIKSLARSDKVRNVCGTISWSMKGQVKQFASTVGRTLVSSGLDN